MQAQFNDTSCDYAGVVLNVSNVQSEHACDRISIFSKGIPPDMKEVAVSRSVAYQLNASGPVS